MPVLATAGPCRSAVAARAGLDATAAGDRRPVPRPHPRRPRRVAPRHGPGRPVRRVAAARPLAGSVEARALELLGPDPEPLVRRMIVLTART